MSRHNVREILLDIVWISLGSALFALGFDLFLRPNEINGGGLSGLALLFSEVTGFQALGTFVLVCNIPLFFLGWKHIGRRFFWGSLLGMLVSSILIDVFVLLPGVQTEPLLAGLYGGVLVGAGLGVVFVRGASTGGMDIVGRLIKRKMRHAPIGRIMFGVDILIVILTGLVYRDVNKSLYSALTLFVLYQVMDMIIYGRNDSGVALIISDLYQEIADAIDQRLDRGATLLPATGAYTSKQRTVILCAVKSQQVGQLEALVAEVDPDAFVILQKAHQVLGDGFGRYSADGL